MRGCRAVKPRDSGSARPGKEQAERAHGPEGTARVAGLAQGYRLPWPAVQAVLGAVLGAVLVLAGLALAAVGWLGWRGRLRRNRFVGIRTAATLVSEDAFRLANRVAAVPLLAAAAVAVLGGAAALAAPSVGAYAVVLGVAIPGTLALMTTGGVLGSRAAAAVGPSALGVSATAGAAASGPAPCAGCLCGGSGNGAAVRACLRDAGNR
jgi:hypothetical protein